MISTTVIRGNAYQILFGGDLNNQKLVETLPIEAKKEVFNCNVLHAVKDELGILSDVTRSARG